MTIRVGSIDLIGLQEVYTEDSQALVELRGPGQAGGFFQDLGREPMTVVMSGILFGEEPSAALEELRQAQQEARPLPFAADVIAGAEFTDVLILDLKVRQIAGARGRYSFFLRVREHTEAPEPADAGIAEVERAVEAEADAWNGGAIDAASVLEDPASLAPATAANPSLLDNLSEDELVDLLGAATPGSSGEALGGVLVALGERDPAALGGALTGIRERGGLAAIIDKLAAAGAVVRERLAALDLAAMLPIVLDMVNGTGVVADLKRVMSAADALASELQAFDPDTIFGDIEDGGEP